MIKSFTHRISRRVELGWRLQGDPVAFARWLGVTVGDNCRFIGLQLWTFGSEPYMIKIGDHVTVSHNARFITHDGGVWIFRDEFPDIDIVAPIVVGNNVFIGANAMILPGVTIDDNVIVAAGAIVTRDIASGTIVAGVPARPISTVADYRERVLARATHLRSRSAAEKREAWTKDLT